MALIENARLQRLQRENDRLRNENHRLRNENRGLRRVLQDINAVDHEIIQLKGDIFECHMDISRRKDEVCQRMEENTRYHFARCLDLHIEIDLYRLEIESRYQHILERHEAKRRAMWNILQSMEAFESRRSSGPELGPESERAVEGSEAGDGDTRGHPSAVGGPGAPRRGQRLSIAAAHHSRPPEQLGC
jgi:regulator of replication initiation timing